MASTFDLTKMDPHSFEHMVNLLAMRVLGMGHTGFGPGPDGGRDGYYEGEAPYPSLTDRWKGTWYIQSKFHSPHLSRNPQKWLTERVQEEIKEFSKKDSKRKWPDNWIVATNIEPSAAPMTGAFDKVNTLVTRSRRKLRNHFHIWGGRKILDLLAMYPDVSKYYGHFLTPGHVLTALYDQLKDAQAEAKTILRYLIVRQFGEQQYTKLEQAGSAADTRPGIHRLFIDLPFKANEFNMVGLVTEHLVRASAKNHRVDPNQPDTKNWRLWNRFPARARVWFIKGGPGQGKSTIGQYFCQIQRAALILQDDAPPVVPQLKAVAREIQRAAKKSEFWPSTPRIPISIELKEYAQWFGLKPKREPRGVLTYLTERIAASVEQKVLVGTLKRALQTRSWFVVFDGLDEVPHDVKDAVALEVRHFVDDIGLESGADLLTLCTSRPQGYSGQFAELDGPTIELVPLSADRALECARPVLELDRTEVEATKTLQILTSAVQSTSVRELMTTPLQAHIMAVVVRDGGRPPDRRWQLFTNFYQVIKRREANRDLPDHRLAKLLREDTQLLKAVHSRLGFALQASAETSKGAQTHLNRSDFENLVAEAVVEMIEGDSRETVAVLMEATTDRLVLVSTPDDGNHVRFDIRPLQEFFAAEFFYEAVDADTLGKRMELVGGDSHWREVMHFLVSALIENSRLTELSVAVQVLEHLNEGTGEPETRLLARRLGRGALLAARLLSEGVLEQDKRIRQQARKCLEPITGITDLRVLRLLGATSQTNSKAWLFNFLVDSLREDDPTESIGSAILLITFLPDGHERTTEVASFLLAAPAHYLTAVLESRGGDRSDSPRSDSPPIQNWLLGMVLKLLTRPGWVGLGESGIRSAVQILSISKDNFPQVASDNGLDGVQIGLAKQLFSKDTYASHSTDVDYGFLRGSLRSHDWTTGNSVPKNWNEKQEQAEVRDKGILDLVFRILRFSYTRTLSNLHSIFQCMNGGNPEVLKALPSELQAFLPLDFSSDLNDQITKLICADEREFKILMNERRIGLRILVRPVRFLVVGESYDLASWKRLISEHPGIALHLWSDSFWRRMPIQNSRPDFLDGEEGIDALLGKILENHEVLSQHPELWGRLLLKAERYAGDLRKAFLRAAGHKIRERRFWSPGLEFHPFKLMLPHEASLLPPLMKSLCAAYRVDNVYVADVGIIDFNVDPDSLRHHISGLAGAEELDVLSKDPDTDVEIKAAALLLSLLHPDGKTSLGEVADDIVRLYSPHLGSWYFTAIIIVVGLLADNESSVANSMIAKILSIAREDYAGRKQLDWLLNRWRESSSAPVQKAGVQRDWLTQS